MTEHDEVGQPEVAPDLPETDRETAPQSEYTTRHVGIGIGVLLVGLVLTYGLALAL